MPCEEDLAVGVLLLEFPVDAESDREIQVFLQEPEGLSVDPVLPDRARILASVPGIDQDRLYLE